MQIIQNGRVAILAVFATMALTSAPAAAQQQKPNILFILADTSATATSVRMAVGNCAGPRRRVSISSPPGVSGWRSSWSSRDARHRAPH
jgi:hypothetical protein